MALTVQTNFLLICINQILSLGIAIISLISILQINSYINVNSRLQKRILFIFHSSMWLRYLLCNKLNLAYVFRNWDKFCSKFWQYFLMYYKNIVEENTFLLRNSSTLHIDIFKKQVKFLSYIIFSKTFSFCTYQSYKCLLREGFFLFYF